MVLSPQPKFGRVCNLKVELPNPNKTRPDTYINIDSPDFTFEFEVKTDINARANTAHITVYNLNQQSRNNLFKDWFESDLKDAAGNTYFRAVQFSAGYKNAAISMMPMIFNGRLLSAFSTREGTDYKTELECTSIIPQIAPATINETVDAGKSKAEILVQLSKALKPYGVNGAVIGSFATQISQRGTVLYGNVLDIVRELTKNKFYFDDDKMFILNDNEVLPGELATISFENGLLGTPKRSKSLLEFSMIFEPRVKISQQIQIESITEPIYNGQYKVVGIEHRGTISPSVCGECDTTITCIAGEIFTPVTSLGGLF